MGFTRGAPSNKRGADNPYLVINPNLFLAANSYIYLLRGISTWLSRWHVEFSVSKTECVSCIPRPHLLPCLCHPSGKPLPRGRVILTSSVPTFSDSPICQHSLQYVPFHSPFPMSRAHFPPPFTCTSQSPLQGSLRLDWPLILHTGARMLFSPCTCDHLALLTAPCSQEEAQVPHLARPAKPRGCWLPLSHTSLLGLL